MLRRLRGVVHYDGTAYRGWQRQADASTVQGASEASLASLLGAPASIVAAGRTDTGVHARGQVIHFDHDTNIDADDLRRAWNAKLPDDIWIETLSTADADFHARYDAVSRVYRYFVADGPGAHSPFTRRYQWALDRSPDWTRIREATGLIVGRHDFARFSKGPAPPAGRGALAPGECVVTEARWQPTSEGHCLELRANRFLRHMVRSLVGALIAVGQGRLPVDEIRSALLEQGARPRSGNAPPQGLFLWRVEYGAEG